MCQIPSHETPVSAILPVDNDAFSCISREASNIVSSATAFVTAASFVAIFYIFFTVIGEGMFITVLNFSSAE